MHHKPDRNRIMWEMHQWGYGYKEIAWQFGICSTAVQDCIKRFKKNVLKCGK
jgi:predicted DNA-binding protein YlxM (UPF0122 family)